MKIQYRKIVSFILCASLGMGVLTSCAIRQQAVPDQRDAYLNALAGVWDNSAQFATTASALKIPPSVNGDWLDLQYASFTSIDAPLIGDRVLYLEWRSGGSDGPISRQRIWSFHQDASSASGTLSALGNVRMDFYAFVDGKPWAGRANEAGAFRALNKAQLRGYGDACGLVFRENAQHGNGFVGAIFIGAITAKECSITAASGRRMGIDARVELTVNGTLEYRESGQLEDGRYAFRVPPGAPYRFRRLAR